MAGFSHTDEKGKANMVDVSPKPDQLRIASASGMISLSPDTLKLISENLVKKGDVLTVAEIAGIQAAKQTSSLIPLCHPLQITKVTVNARPGTEEVTVISEVKCIGQTGVEMEALTAVSVALLTIYDMCKAVDKNMVISDIKLIEKQKMDLE
ncbi:MAG: cyclic pyranopterin monophosphate synthase MoaC [Bacteroidia bacterium]|nr:cyclic pyranopterin monophosphate synthase MoaC [Bacteroidia bacterium]